MVRKEALGQILPRPGHYPVAVRMISGGQSSRLAVSDEAVTWTRSWQENEIEICFAVNDYDA
jgi:hypothetical protein